MNREIKFRAWLDYGNGSGEMLPNIQNHINGDWAFGHIILGNVDNVSEPMQFTGLKDKNGVEIYEAMEIDGIYVVGFKDSSYVLIDISSGDIVLLHDYIKCRGGDVRVTREYAKI